MPCPAHAIAHGMNSPQLDTTCDSKLPRSFPPPQVGTVHPFEGVNSKFLQGGNNLSDRVLGNKTSTILNVYSRIAWPLHLENEVRTLLPRLAKKLFTYRLASSKTDMSRVLFHLR